jgi:hypothetical protein
MTAIPHHTLDESSISYPKSDVRSYLTNFKPLEKSVLDKLETIHATPKLSGSITINDDIHILSIGDTVEFMTGRKNRDVRKGDVSGMFLLDNGDIRVVDIENIPGMTRGKKNVSVDHIIRIL